MTPKTISLDELIEAGLTVGGRPADRIKVRIPGVGWSLVSLPLVPSDAKGEPKDGSELNPTQKRIMAVLEKEREPVTRRYIANKLERQSVGGKFSLYIADLVSRRLVFEYAGELANDTKKFADD